MTRTRLPSLAALRAFEATVRLGGVARAARELHVTDGAVSRAVRELEAELGFDLFRRAHRLVVPTPLARELAGDVAEGLDRLRRAVARARAVAGSGRALVLSCEPTLLIRWLIPRLGGLQEALGPERELRLVSAGGPVPFAHEGIDLAIRRADFALGSDAVAKPFLDEVVGPVCRPDLAGALGASGPVEGTLLHTATRPDAWAAWARLTGTELRPTREQRFEHFYQTLQAAVAGAGTAIGPIALVADDLAAGTLAAPRGLVPDGTHYVLMRLAGGEPAEGFDAALAWLRGMAEDLPNALS